MIAARLLGELPLDSSATNVPCGFERQSQVVSTFMIAAHPGQRFGKMWERSSILSENHFQTSCRTIQSDAVGETHESALVGRERDHQLPVSLLIGSQRQKIVSATIPFRGKFMGRLFPGLDLVMADKIVLAFRVPQQYLARRISQFDSVVCIGRKTGENLPESGSWRKQRMRECYRSGAVQNAYRRIR